MKRFDKHIFVCENKRAPGHPKGCCADKNSSGVRDYLKKRIAELGLNSSVRVNSSGCLDACEFGLTIVVYPEGVWYGNVVIDDVEEIIQQHIMQNHPVERLKIKDAKFNRDEKQIGN